MGGENSLQSELVIVIESDKTDPLNPGAEIGNTPVSDPVADFLEKHGHELTRDHKGETITYFQAVEKCSSLAVLIAALGEGVLSLTAAEHIEEKPPEETETVAEEGAVREAKEKRAEVEASVSIKSKDQERLSSQTHRTDKAEAAPESRAVETADILNDRQLVTEVAADKTQPAGNFNEPALPASRETAPPKASFAPAALEAASVSGVSSQNRSYNTAPEMKSETAPTLTDHVEISPETPATEPNRFGRETLAADIFIRPVEISTQPSQKEDSGEVTETSLGPVGLELSEKTAAPEPATWVTPEDTTRASSAVGNEEIDSDLAEASETADAEKPDSQPVINAAGETTVTPHELPAPMAGVEQTIADVAEAVAELEPDEAELVEEILDEIAFRIEDLQDWQTSGSAARISEQSVVEETEADILEPAERSEKPEAEIEKLFIKLFDYLEIDYSPELVESFAQLTTREISGGSPVLTRTGDRPLFTAKEGTHEIIKQLLATTAGFKTELIRAYQLGKSVIGLYFSQLSAA